MRLKNIHPGEILLEEFIIPLGLSQNKLAREVDVPPRRINEIVLEKRSVTADTDLRLSKFFGTSPGFWLNLQHEYDLEEKSHEIKETLDHIKRFKPDQDTHHASSC
jgi:addiction module HigA family antidote